MALRHADERESTTHTEKNSAPWCTAGYKLCINGRENGVKIKPKSRIPAKDLTSSETLRRPARKSRCRFSMCLSACCSELPVSSVRTNSFHTREYMDLTALFGSLHSTRMYLRPGAGGRGQGARVGLD